MNLVPCVTQLHEAAIDVSSVVLAAEKMLTDLYSKILHDAAQGPIYVGNKLADVSPQQRYTVAMAHYHKDRQRGFSAAYRCMYVGSAALTKLVQEFMLKDYGVDNDDDGRQDGVMLAGLYYPISNIRVLIEKDNVPDDASGHMLHRSDARAFRATHGGVADDARHFAGCKIFLDKPTVEAWLDIVDTAVADLVYTAFEGQYQNYEPGYYPDMLVEYVIPTFSHEIDHLVYYARKPNDKSGISMIGTGGRKGRRKYDNATTPHQRYLGSHIELQAFASSAAISLLRANVTAIGKRWMTLHDEVFDLNDPQVWNAIIKRVIRKITDGRLASSDIWRYRTAIRDAQPDNVSYQRVWRQFLKLVVAKLKRYEK